MLLNHELISAPGGTPAQSIIFLHGILGTGGNLRSHARRFVQARPHYQAVLMDLRAHGESLGRDGEDTLSAAAADVEQTAEALGHPVHAVVGHSFGGKVTLMLAHSRLKPAAVMTLDSAPGPRPGARGSETTASVLSMLDTLHGPWATREAFVTAVVGAGFSLDIARWLAMNLGPSQAGFVFRLELPRIHALLRDYLAVDLWPVVEGAAQNRQGPRIHLVIGTKSQVYEKEDRARAKALESAASGQVTVDELQAGHWVHVEDPQGLAETLQRRLV